MLSIAAITSASYYTSATTAEYFQEGGNSPGRWWGPAARSLRVRGPVTAASLERLLLGQGADGAALVQQQRYRDGRTRQAAWDLTFSAPKSVSIIWSQATPKVRKRLVAAHREAVAAALDYLQDAAAWTRRGKGGATRETVRLVGALFDHHTNRELEPHLHTHLVLPNLGVREDGTTGTILSQPLYRHKMAAGALYRAALDHALQRELGLQTRRSGTSFEIRGVSRELIDEHSQRRQQIKKALAAKGLASARAAAVATLDTRRTKQAQSLDALQPGWRATNARLGLTTGKLEALLGRQKERNQDRDARRAVTRAIREITDHANSFSSRELVTASAVEALSRGVSAKKLVGAIQQALTDPRKTMALKDSDGERRYTTPQIRQLEVRLVEQAAALHKRQKNLVTEKRIERGCQKWLPIQGTKEEKRRNMEQQAAVRRLTSGGDLQILEGLAGTGKTYTLQACRRIWEAQGFRVFGAALSGGAARELEKGSGIASEPVALRLKQFAPTIAERVKHHAQQLIRAAVKKPTFSLTPLKITRGTVLVVDEAGMLGSAQLAKLVDATRRGGGKLVLVGDTQQLQPIDAGGPLTYLSGKLGAARLENITRQAAHPHDPQPLWARDSVRLLSQGEAARAIKLFADRGRLSVSASRDEALRNLVQDWSCEGAKRPQESLILTATKRERDQANRLCQEARLKGAGRFQTAPRYRFQGEEFTPGDRIAFGKKSRSLGVENGDRGTLLEVGRFGRTMRVQHDDGRQVVVPLRKYKELRLGYASTTHAAQGRTVDYTYVLLGGKHQDLHMSYVQASRSRLETRLYTDRLEAAGEAKQLSRQMSRTRTKSLIVDLGHER